MSRQSQSECTTSHIICSGDESFSAKMQKAMLMALGKAPRELEHIDMSKKLQECGLLDLVPAAAWPPTQAVCLLYVAGTSLHQSAIQPVLGIRELATMVRKLEKSGSPRPYVAVDLRKCVSLLRPEPCHVDVALLLRAGSCLPFARST